MMEIKVKTKKWGNSIGILIPKEAAKKENIKPDQEITVLISAKPITRGKDIWGTMKFSKSTEELMREVDKELDFGF
ncbi:AbrB/MazE/SpoVT family DNA-binding domain-containing protein [Candidatus Woesearchaeota archaeon]|nr:AbrB/MazE/SpoVT family DNA-binding domain-containing protein [Candidatus Woesearchaeota archaeon]